MLPLKCSVPPWKAWEAWLLDVALLYLAMSHRLEYFIIIPQSQLSNISDQKDPSADQEKEILNYEHRSSHDIMGALSHFRHFFIVLAFG